MLTKVWDFFYAITAPNLLIGPSNGPFEFQRDDAFMKIIPKVLNSEGGYVNHPSDPGGPTKYGIAYNYNKQILHSMGINNVRDLTYDQAKQIYYVKYWKPSGAINIRDIDLAYIHFDAAVNCGIEQANLFLARLSHNPLYFEADGKNLELWFSLWKQYLAQRLSFYTHAKNRKSFLEGWINRMVDVIRTTFNG